MRLRITLLAAILIMAMGSFVFADNATHCVKKQDVWGERCQGSDGLMVVVTNNCASTIYVKMCLARKDGKWECYSDSNLAPGKSNNGFYACRATGEVKWNACTGGYSECGFKSPQ
jgi:hypothetical protein